jgi:hypothetical protein
MADPDRRSTLLDSYENAAVIVSGIAADELSHPTPCPNYDVAALIDHLVEAGHRAAALGCGQAPPPGDQSPHVGLSDAPGQLRSAAEQAAQAWGDDSSLSLTSESELWTMTPDGVSSIRPASSLAISRHSLILPVQKMRQNCLRDCHCRRSFMPGQWAVIFSARPESKNS